MDALFEFGLEATRWLQAQYPSLEGFMRAVSYLGEFEVFLAILPLIYWSLHKQLGRSLVFVLALGEMLNGLAKLLGRGPRPFWLEPNVGLGEAEDYGLPSGHTASTTLVFGFMALWFRRAWLWLLAAAAVLLMGLSRVYLGVHFPHDVLGGFLLAALVLIGYWFWERRIAEPFSKRILGQRLMVALAVPLLLALTLVAAMLLRGPLDPDYAWLVRGELAEESGLSNAVRNLGVLFGLGIGLVLEGSRVRFLVAGPWWQRAGRYVIGMAGVLAIWLGLGQLFPEEPAWIAIPLRLLRYGLLGLWAAYYAPALFVKLHLAQATPPPAIDLTLRPLDKI